MARREGLKAVEMFEAIERGEIKALWVMATNPAVSLPRAGAVREALRKLDLFVVSENVASNDTVNAGAHILLPAAAWGEKDGTVTNSERRISRQRPFLPLPGEARPDWWIVTQVARRMGFAEGVRLCDRRPIFSASMPRCRLSRTAARAISISAGSRSSAMRRSMRSIRCNGRRAWVKREAKSGRNAVLRARRLLHRGPQGPVDRGRKAAAAGAGRRRTFRCGSIPDACAINGTP